MRPNLPPFKSSRDIRVRSSRIGYTVTAMESRPTLFTNGKLIHPDRSRPREEELLVVDGRIAQCGTGLKGHAPKAKVVDLKGQYLSPGFIDIHVHFREPGQEHKETIATGAAAAAAGGFTTVCCMPNTNPALDDPAQIEFVLNQARRADLCRVLPFGAITKGREGKELAELRLMHEAGTVGFSDDGVGVGSAAVMNKAFQYVKMFDGLISQHCEEPTLSGGPMNAGLTANRLGLTGLPAAAEELMIARDLILNRTIGARYHVQHISTAGAVELVRQARANQQRVTAEVAPHHLLLTEEACAEYDTHTKMNPPLRTQADVDACIAGVTDGTIEVLATDHAPHAREEKEQEFDRAPFGIVGLETAFPLYLEALVRRKHISLPKMIALMTVNPARVIQQENVGTLRLGGWADLTVFDPDEEWTIDPARFKSKSRNTPFAGRKVHGRIKMTVLQGRVVYQDGVEKQTR